MQLGQMPNFLSKKKKKGLMPNDAKPYLNYNSNIYRGVSIILENLLTKKIILCAVK